MLEYTVEKNGLDDFILETLDSYKEYDIFPKASDTAWLVGNFFGKHEIPGWQGYMKIICKQEFVECTKVMALPFVMNPPSDRYHIYLSLHGS